MSSMEQQEYFLLLYTASETPIPCLQWKLCISAGTFLFYSSISSSRDWQQKQPGQGVWRCVPCAHPFPPKPDRWVQIWNQLSYSERSFLQLSEQATSKERVSKCKCLNRLIPLSHSFTLSVESGVHEKWFNCAPSGWTWHGGGVQIVDYTVSDCRAHMNALSWEQMPTYRILIYLVDS